MTNIFFYGLFMDQALLTTKGLHPDVIGSAVLDGYRIHIGERATLIPAPSSRAYGIVMALSEAEAEALYSEPSVSEYRPEAVDVVLLESSEALDAVCYNLPSDLGLAGTNPGYARELARLVERLGLDPAYAEEIAAFATPR